MEMIVLVKGTIKSHILYELMKLQKTIDKVIPLYINHKRGTDCMRIKQIYPNAIIDNTLNFASLSEEDFQQTKHLFFQTVSSLYGERAVVGISANTKLPGYELTSKYISPFITMSDLEILEEFIQNGIPIRELHKVNTCECNSCDQCFIRFYTFSYFGIRTPLFQDINKAVSFLERYQGKDVKAIKRAIRLLKRHNIKDNFVHWDFSSDEHEKEERVNADTKD